VVPVVTGHVDWAALDQWTDAFLLTRGIGGHPDPGPGQPAGVGQPTGTGEAARPDGTGQRRSPGPGQPGGTGQQPWPGQHGGSGQAGSFRPGQPGSTGQPSWPGEPAGPGGGHRTVGPGPAPAPLSPAARDRLRRALLGLAADTLSGPDGLAARLRAAHHGTPLATTSLPLDIGAATETIPAHLRRAATTRHPHCAFPGCDQPTSVCQIHHLIPRSAGGPTALRNLVPLCAFHHLTVIHRWGWTLRLKPDGTTTATSPDGQRVFHSHSPPTPGHGPPGHGPPGHGPPGHHDDPPAQAA
jgi:hypothetical protein